MSGPIGEGPTCKGAAASPNAPHPQLEAERKNQATEAGESMKRLVLFSAALLSVAPVPHLSPDEPVAGSIDVAEQVRLLNEGDSQSRLGACLVLQSHSSELRRAVPALISALCSGDYAVACAASWALCSIGSACLPGLICAVRDKGYACRARAIGVLGEIAIATPEVTQVLEDQLGSRDPLLEREAAYALARLGSRGAPAKRQLVALAEHGSQRSQVAANCALAQIQIGNTAPIIQLRRALSDPSIEVAMEAAMAIARVGPIAGECGPALLAARSRDKRLALRCYQTLRRLGPAGAQSLVPLLSDRALDDIGLAAVIRVLADLGEDASEALPLLAELLVSREGHDVALAAAYGIGRMGQRAVAHVPELLAALESADPELQDSVVVALGLIGPGASGALPALRRLRDGGSLLLRTRAAVAIISIDRSDNESLRRIEQDLASPDTRVREIAALSLSSSNVRDAHLLRQVLPLLGDPDPVVALAAAERVAAAAPTSADWATVVSHILASASPEHRRAAILMCDRLGVGAVPVLRAVFRLVDDPDWQIADSAIETLEHILNWRAPAREVER